VKLSAARVRFGAAEKHGRVARARDVFSRAVIFERVEVVSASGLCGLRARNAFLVEQRRQFTRLEHFAGDVAASDNSLFI